MANDFDPYRKWLGIPPNEQPPTHYRLLAIAEFEDDPDVISNASDRCMAHVRTFQSGNKSQLSQKILNELAEARVCLLDPDRKKQYDAALSQQKAEAVAPPPAPIPSGVPVAAPVGSAVDVPVGAAVPVGETVASTKSNGETQGVAVQQKRPRAVAGSPALPTVGGRSATASVRTRSRQKSSPAPVIIGVGAVLLLGVILIAALNSDDKEAEVDEQPPRKSAPRATPPTKPKDRSPKKPPVVRRDPQTKPVETIVSPPRPPRDNPGEDAPSTLAETIKLARGAMARNRLDEATRLLHAGDRLASSPEQTQQLDRWKQLLGMLKTFDRLLLGRAAKLEPGFEIQLGDSKSKVVYERFAAGESPTLHFTSDGQPVKVAIDNLPADWAYQIVAPAIEEDPEHALPTAVFLAIRSEGDRLRAAQMFDAAAKSGLADSALLAELNLPSIGGPQPAPGDKPGPKPARRTPIPEREALRNANAALRERYRAEIVGAKTDEDKAALAKTLYNASRQASDEPALQYALLSEAMEQATELARPKAFLLMIDDLAETFEVDRLDLKSLQLKKAGVSTSTVEQNEEIQAAALALYPDAKATQRYDVAHRLVSTAWNAARRAKDWDAFRDLDDEVKRMELLAAEMESGIRARQTLAESPDDPQANTLLGRMECFLNDNWSGGLPMLAKGGDSSLAELAQRDLASPDEAAVRAALAADWLAMAKRKGGAIKPGMLRRAQFWYDRSIDELEGEQAAEAKSRLNEIEQLLAEDEGPTS